MSDATAPTEDFLRAEEAAGRLAESLGRLDQEANSYSAAGKTLEQVAAEVRALASGTSAVAALTGEAVDAIRSVGSVQILERVQALSAGSEASAAAIETMGTKLDAMGEQATAIQQSVASVHDRLELMSKELTDSVASVAEEVRAGGESVQSKIVEQGATTQTQIDAATKVATMARNAAIAAAVLALIAAIMTRF